MKTFTFAAGAAVGYVLGTKAGREKYQQIVDGARNFGQTPAVQQAQSKIKDLVGQGTSAVTNKIGAADSSDTTTSFDGETTVKTTRTPKKATTSEVADNLS